MKYYLGLDMGTTGVKAAVFTPDGVMAGSGLAEYTLETPSPDIVELETDAVNGTGFYTEAYYYKPIIVNAITGETTNPNDISEGRMLLPESYMKWIDGQ